MNFASVVFQKPRRSGRKHNIGRTVLDRIASWPNSAVDHVVMPAAEPHRIHTLCANEFRAKAKLEDGTVMFALLFAL